MDSKKTTSFFQILYTFELETNAVFADEEKNASDIFFPAKHNTVYTAVEVI